MSRFTTRIELYDYATEENYKTLHAEMLKLFFYREITATNTGESFHMPPAQYDSSGDITISRVMELAEQAASKVGKPYAVFITQSAGILFTNLKPL